MSALEPRLAGYLQHILEAIDRIERYVNDMDGLGFQRNELVQDAVIRNLEIIGEASRNVTKHYPEYVKQHADVPFSIAYEMRNALAHGYFKVDLEVVWRTIERDLPELEEMIESLLNRQD
ncbi:MAG: DUF86 domain-containing protein [Gammaproteobacteria bacterium]|nr:DUF86 domain-containing protein [Gammaproteobacteria bacterium]